MYNFKLCCSVFLTTDSACFASDSCSSLRLCDCFISLNCSSIYMYKIYIRSIGHASSSKSLGGVCLAFDSCISFCCSLCFTFANCCSLCSSVCLTSDSCSQRYKHKCHTWLSTTNTEAQSHCWQSCGCWWSCSLGKHALALGVYVLCKV